MVSAKQKNELELVKNNVQLLNEMLSHYSPGVDIRLEDNEIIQALALVTAHD